MERLESNTNGGSKGGLREVRAWWDVEGVGCVLRWPEGLSGQSGNTRSMVNTIDLVLGRTCCDATAFREEWIEGCGPDGLGCSELCKRILLRMRCLFRRMPVCTALWKAPIVMASGYLLGGKLQAGSFQFLSEVHHKTAFYQVVIRSGIHKCIWRV